MGEHVILFSFLKRHIQYKPKYGYMWELMLEQTLLLVFTMSKQSLFRPHCLFQKNIVSQPIINSYMQHHRSPSQGSILEEMPTWLDYLLSEEDADFKGMCLS
jgi:hypothetical protein